MASIRVAVVQTPWDCRWSQPGHRLTGVDEDHQPEGRWVCTRSMPIGLRRTVTDEECATCEYWEADEKPVSCPQCRGTRIDITGGDDLVLESIRYAPAVGYCDGDE